MTCSLCDPNSKDPRRFFEGCFCHTEKWYKEGYDAVVEIVSRGLAPTFILGMNRCPYMLGTEMRQYWMKGWNKAREDM